MSLGLASGTEQDYLKKEKRGNQRRREEGAGETREHDPLFLKEQLCCQLTLLQNWQMTF